MKLFLSLIAALFVCMPAFGQTILTSAGGTEFSIQSQGSGGLHEPLQVSGWPQICIRSCFAEACDADCTNDDVYNAGGAVATNVLDDQGVVTSAQTIAGLVVRRHIFVPRAAQSDGNNFIRYIDELTNSTGADITVMVRIGTMVHPDADAALNPADGALTGGYSRIHKTSTDDAEFSPLDRWLVVDDDLPNDGLHNVGVLHIGAGSRIPFMAPWLAVDNVTGNMGLSWDFRNVTVPSGQTVRFLTAIVIDESRDETIAELENLKKAQRVDLLSRLTEQERNELYNFDVNVGNAAPVADAGGPYVLQEGQQLPLTGARSFDAEEQPLQYDWDLTENDGPNFDNHRGAVRIIDPNPDDPIGRQILQAGSHTFALKVTDANGKTDVDYAKVTVTNTPPSVSDVTTRGQVDGRDEVGQVDEGSTLTVTVLMNELNFTDAYVFDVDWNTDDLLGYEGIGNVLGDVAVGDPNRYSTDVIYDADGRYNARIRVRDDDGAQVERDFTVTVNNVAPSIEQILPPSIQLLNEGEPFNVSSIASDPGNDRLSYEYTLAGCNFINGNQAREVIAQCPDDQTYNLEVKVCDDAQACVTRNQFITVGNVAPTVLSVTTVPAAGLLEGSPVTIQVAAVDQGNDPLTYEFDFDGDGLFESAMPQADATATFVYGRPGEYEVLVRVSDGDENVIGRHQLTVLNVAPTAEVEGPGQAGLGRMQVYTCIGQDPGQARFKYHWDVDGDGIFERRNAPSTLSVAFDRIGSHTIGCEVIDGEGGRAQATRDVFVANESPPVIRAEIVSDSAGMEEGAEITVRVTAVGEQTDDLVYTYYFDAGVDDDELVNDDAFIVRDSPDSTVRFAYPQQGRYRIKVVVTDAQNTFTTDTRTAQFEIRNVLPTLRILPIQMVLEEGGQAIVTATVSDPGQDQLTVYWDLNGDGERDEVVDVIEPNMDGRITRTFAVPDDDINLIRAWAHDNDDPEQREVEAQLTIRINNVAPKIPDNWMPREAYEGEVYNRSIPFVDPGFFDAVSFSLSGNPPEGILIDEFTGSILANEPGVLWTPTYEQYRDNNPLRLQVRLTDDDGGSSLSLLEIPIIPIDEDEDGLPDTYEKQIFGVDDPSDIQPDGDEDEDGLSNETEWREGTNPTVYDGPGQTRLVSPENELRIDVATPQLVAARVTEAVSGERARIEFEVYADEAGETLVTASDPIVQPEEGDTRWIVPAGILEENTWYWWRARSVGERLQTQWSDFWRFQVDAINSTPTKPELIAPADGYVIGEVDDTFVFVASTSDDDDGDEVTYTIRWFKQDPQTGQVTTTSARGEVVMADDGPEVHFTAPPLSEDTTYSWDVIAQDTRSGLAESEARWRFHVDVKNAQPTAPSLTMEQAEEFVVLKDPESGDNVIAPVSESRPTFRASGSEDLENDPISYVFEVADSDDMVVLTSEQILADDQGSAEWRTPDALLEDAFFQASVYAIDARGGESARAVGIFQVSGQNEPPPMPEHISPTDGSEISPERAIAIWSEVTDPEGTAVKYIVEYCLSDGACERGAPQSETSYAFEFLGEDGRTVRWSVQAVDADGLGSSRTEPWAFTFNVVASSDGANAGDDGCNCDVGRTTRNLPIMWLTAIFGLFVLRPRRKTKH